MMLLTVITFPWIKLCESSHKPIQAYTVMIWSTLHRQKILEELSLHDKPFDSPAAHPIMTGIK